MSFMIFKDDLKHRGKQNISSMLTTVDLSWNYSTYRSISQVLFDPTVATDPSVKEPSCSQLYHIVSKIDILLNIVRPQPCPLPKRNDSNNSNTYLVFLLQRLRLAVSHDYKQCTVWGGSKTLLNQGILILNQPWILH